MPRMMFSTRARLARRCSSDSLSKSKEDRESGWEGAWELWLERGSCRAKEEEEGGGGRGGPGERQSEGLSRSREELLQPSSAWISEPPLDRFPLPCCGGRDGIKRPAAFGHSRHFVATLNRSQHEFIWLPWCLPAFLCQYGRREYSLLLK